MSFSDESDDYETFERDRLAEDDEGGIYDHEREPGRNVPERIDPHRCACGLRYTEDEYTALECPGVMCLETGYAHELRQCLCRSTMARVLRPVTAEVQAYLDGETDRRGEWRLSWAGGEP